MERIRTTLNNFIEKNDGILKALTYSATIIGTPVMIGNAVYNLLRSQPTTTVGWGNHGAMPDEAIACHHPPAGDGVPLPPIVSADEFHWTG